MQVRRFLRQPLRVARMVPSPPALTNRDERDLRHSDSMRSAVFVVLVASLAVGCGRGSTKEPVTNVSLGENATRLVECEQSSGRAGATGRLVAQLEKADDAASMSEAGA